MANWHCFKDKVPLATADILMSYLDTTNAIEGLKCPKCGMVFLTEETVVDKVNQAEQMLENK